MRKKGNIYFVNTVNIENTVNTAKKTKTKTKKLIHLTLPTDRSLSVESTP